MQAFNQKCSDFLRLKFRNTVADAIGYPDMGSVKGHPKGKASYGKGAEVRAVASSQLCCCACNEVVSHPD